MQNGRPTKLFYGILLCILAVFILLFIGQQIQIASITKSSVSKKREICYIDPLDSLSQFYKFLRRPPKPLCQNLLRIGGSRHKEYVDGDKYVCFDEEIGIKPNNCLILSFGINNEWSFDDIMDFKYGCQVHAFDPTMGVYKDYKRSKNIYFHNLGISDKPETVVINKRLAKLDRMENILEIYGLTNRTIDYLKMDVEGAEVRFLSDIFKYSPHILSNIIQIGMEIHPWTAKHNDSLPTNTFKIMFEQLQKLECYGFEVVSIRMNELPFNHYIFQNKTEACCYEIVWINTLYLNSKRKYIYSNYFISGTI